MAKAEITEVLDVDKARFWKAVTTYEDYPKFVDGCTNVKVERKGDGKVRATYSVSLMKDVTYTLDHVEDEAAGILKWSLVDSDFFKKNDGHWEIKAEGNGKTRATYVLDVDFKIPVPGFILGRLVKGNLPSMVKGFAQRAKEL